MTVSETLQASRFLTLPLEIKSQIYRLLLTPKRKVFWTHSKVFIERMGFEYKRFMLIKRPVKRHTAILRVTKQVHDEATAVLYGCSKFIFFPHCYNHHLVSEMMILYIPQRYRDLIRDVTLKAFDANVPLNNIAIWASVSRPYHSRISIRNRRLLTIYPNEAPSRRNKWNGVNFGPQTPFEVEPLCKCRNLRSLTVELLPSFYERVWGGGAPGHTMEEVEDVKELLKIRGLEKLTLVDMGNIKDNLPHLAIAKEQVEKLLRAELLKP